MSLLISAALINAACAAVLALVAILVGRWCRRPAVLHTLWLLVLVKLVTPPLWPIRLAWLPENAGPSVEVTPVVAVAAPAPETPPPVPLLAPSPAPEAVFGPRSEMSSPAQGEPVSRPPAPPEDNPVSGPTTIAAAPTAPAAPAPEVPAPAKSSMAWSWSLLVGVLWLTGAALALGWSGVRVWRFQRLLREAPAAPADLQRLTRDLALRMGLSRCPSVRLLLGPLPLLVWAVGRPRIYFPAGLLERLDDQEKASLLIHELAHIRRRDHWVRWLELLVLALYWWYPLAWWASRQLRGWEEECCDSWVVAESSPRVYAGAILTTVDFLAESPLPLPAPASCGLGGPQALRRRLTLIMTRQHSRHRSLAGWFAILGVALALPLAPVPAGPAPKTTEPGAPAAAGDAANSELEPVQFDRNPRIVEPVAREIWTVAFAPDGKTVASGCGLADRPGELVLWDVATDKPRVRIPHNRGVRSLTYSPDGKLLATADYVEGTTTVRDAASGKTLRVLRGHTGGVNGVAFAPDSRKLVTAGLDNTVMLWDVATGQATATLRGHKGGVYSVACSPDGKTVLSCGFDRTARVWDVATGAEKFVLEGHAEAVESVAYSPDGRLLATASWDKTIKLWDAATGTEVATLSGHTLPVLCIAFSRDSKYLASGSGKWGHPELPEGTGEVKVWDVAGRKELAALRGHADRVWSVAFAPDGKTLASAGWDKTIRLWDVAGRKERTTLRMPEQPRPALKPLVAAAYAPGTKMIALAPEDGTIVLLDAVTAEVRHVLKGHEDAVTSLVFTPDGRTLASGSVDETVKVWDIRTGKELRTLKGHRNWVFALAFAPEGKTLASGSYDRSIRLWDAATGKALHVLKGHKASVRALAFSPNGKALASGSGDRTVKLWAADGSGERLTLKGHKDSVRAVAFAADGKTLASAGADGTARLWDTATGELRATLTASGTPPAEWTALAFAPRGPLLVTGEERCLRLWDAVRGEPRGSVPGPAGTVIGLSFTPDGQQLFQASADGTTQMWTALLGRAQGARTTLPGRGEHGWTVAFSPDGRTLAAVSGFDASGTLELWDAATGKRRASVKETKALRCVAYSPDGKLLVTAGFGTTVQLRDPMTGAERGTLEGHKDKINSLVFSPDGKLLLTGSLDHTAKLWDVAAAKEVATLEGHGDWVMSVALTPDGKTAATASKDGTIKLWDVATRKEKLTLRGHNDAVEQIAMSPDGKTLASASWDHTLRLWDVATGRPRQVLRGQPSNFLTVAFSPDGRMLASGNGYFGNREPGELRLWDPATGRATRFLVGHARGVRGVGFSPDGRTLASMGEDGVVKLWSLSRAPDRPARPRQD